jgi:tRNA nucleotidyltransferase/poly(A) polymerase
VVGGAVRNALLGEPIQRVRYRHHRSPAGDPAATAAGFKPVPTGIEHGTITA